MITQIEMLNIFKMYVDSQFTSDQDAARFFGISRGHLSRVMNGHKPLTKNLVIKLGYKSSQFYESEGE